MKRLAWLLVVPLLLVGGVTVKRGPGSGVLGSQGTVTIGSALTSFFPTTDIDDTAGIADGAGADPNPFAGDRSSRISSGVKGSAFTNAVDFIHCLSDFNTGCTGALLDVDTYGAGLNIEYSYDNGARSGAEFVEWNWDVLPVTHTITFSAGTGSASAGDNVTFSNGAICRPTATSGLGAVTIRATCVGHVPPVNANTITGGCSGCTGTVSANAADSGYRAFAGHWNTGTNRVNWSLANGVGTTQPTRVSVGYQSGANMLTLGWEGDGTNSANISRVSIPSQATTSSHILARGDIGIDETNAATTGGSFRYHDGTDIRSLNATRTQCFQWTDMDAADDNANIPIVNRMPVTITAMGCRNDTSASPATAATLTLETLAGSDITLTGTPVLCVGNATAMTWFGTVDADAILVTGAGIRFDTTNTPNPATDEHTICVSYIETVQ